MKIIARISDDKVLVEMSAREVARVSGRDYETNLVPERQPYGQRLDGLEVGTTYNVHDAWSRLREQESAAAKLEGVSKTLAALSDLVLQTKVAYTAATAPEGGAN